MTVPIIFRDVNFHIYTISPDCKIYKNGEIIPLDDIIYHSTNGFDYVLLETLSNTQRLYRLEFIMISSFHPGVQHKWEHFKVIHLDGDNKNCHIDNLDYCEDVEELREVVYPETVKRGMYAVSSWGKIKSITNNIIMRYATDKDGYPKIKLMRDDINDSRGLYTHPYRLVAYQFISNQDTMNCFQVNHIDGNKFNNHVSNLEWVSPIMNNQHAKWLKLNYDVYHHGTSKIPTKDVDMVVSMLLDPKHEYSPKLVYMNIDHTKYPDITYNVIRAIKAGDKAYIRKDANYDLKELKFPDGHASKVTTEEIDMVRMMLADSRYNASPKNVYDALDHERYPKLTKSVISHIKNNKSTYVRSDSKFNIDDNIHASGYHSEELMLK